MHFTKALVKVLLVIGIVQLSLQTKAQRVAPVGYEEWISDDFNTFNSSLWSRGLEDDTPGSDKKLIWNNTTGGSGLLNDNYAGYITNEDSYVENGALMLRNQQRVYQGTDPAAQFNYTSGWINSCGKVLINGTERGVCLKLRAKFPVGKEVWPAIWLVTDAPHWPPEIDIWEYFGQFFNSTNKQELMALRFIYGHWTDPTNVKHELLSFDSTYDLTQWHEYSWEWTSEAMIWKIDGDIIGTMTNGVADSGSWPNKVIPSEEWPNEDFALVINNGIMSTLAGQGATTYPNYLSLDWLDIYRAIEAPLTTVFDPLDDQTIMALSSPNATIRTSEPEQFDNDAGRFSSTNTEPAHIIYNVNEINDFSIEFWSWRWAGAGTIKVYGSVDNQSYQEIETSVSSTETFANRNLLTIVPGSSIAESAYNYLKIELSGSDASWKDQVGSVSIKTYNENATDIEVVNSLPDVYVYPNPVSDLLYMKGLSKATSVDVINIGGVIVKQEMVIDQIDLSELSHGVYMLNIKGFNPVRVVKQ
ncbi:glycosyl hydrolase family protein [Labilibacter sediminis]|nr:glycosyl hydrolase family protein [Labilibacter sediminis]